MLRAALRHRRRIPLREPWLRPRAEGGDRIPGGGRVGPLGYPFEQGAGLEPEEPAELVEGLGVEPAENAPAAGEPVGTGIAQRGAFAERIRADPARFHDLVDSQSYH